MDSPRLLLVVMLCTYFHSVHPKTHTVWKCCAKGMQFGEDAQSCVNVPGMKPSQGVENLNPPINGTNFYWLPTALLSETVVANYDSLQYIKTNVTGILYYDKTNVYQFFDSHVKINSLMILDKRYCFETIQNINNTRVQIMSVELAPVHKCCSKNQRLNSVGKCENIDIISENITEEEMINQHTLNSHRVQWLPDDISEYTLRVKYNLLKYEMETDIVSAEGPDFRWDILSSNSDGIDILFRGRKILGTKISGMTEVFCFDQMVNKSSTHKVLVVARSHTKPIQISKCCAKVSMFEVPSSSCSNTQETDSPLSENIDSYVDNETYSWIPHPFNLYPLTVFYDSLARHSSGFTVTKAYSRYADILAPNSELKPVASPMIEKKLLCLDYFADTKIAKEVYKIKPIFKCCALGERLSSDANACEPVPGQIPEPEIEESLEVYPSDTKYLTWLPPEIAKYALNVAYNFLSYRIAYNYIVPEKGYTGLTFTSRYSVFNELQLEGRNASGKTVSLKTRVFCFDEVADGPLSPRVTLAFQREENIYVQELHKCCERGEVLDAESKLCVENKSSERINSETLTDKIDGKMFQWIPQSQKYPVKIHYNTLNHLDSDVRSVVLGETESISDKKVNSLLIWRQSSCYDWSLQHSSRVRVIGYRLKPIPKCCPKNHELTPDGLCVRISGLPFENVVEEVVYPGNSANISWLPSEISHAVKVRYSDLRKNKVHNYRIFEGNRGVWGFTRTAGYQSAIYVNVETDFPSNKTQKTDAYCFEQMKNGATILRILLVRFPKEIWKCCPNKMEISNDTKSCVAQVGITDSFDSWIPDEYKSFPLSVKRDLLSKRHRDFSATVMHVKSKSVFLEGSIVHPAMVGNEAVCYDSSQLSKNVQVIVHTYTTKLLYKCCPKGERLTNSAKGCEGLPGQASEPTSQEIIMSDSVQKQLWIPRNLSDYNIKVGYNFFKFGMVPTVAEREDKLEWDIVPGWKTDNIILFRGLSVSGQYVEGISDHFCFDEVAEGPLAPRALLAITYFVHKCCKKGEYLVNGDITCAPYPGRTVDAVVNGVVNWTSDPLDTYWLPESLKRGQTRTLYNYLPKVFYSKISGMIYDESVWKLDYGPDRFSRIIVNSTDLSGDPFVMEIDAFCFDVLDDSGVVLNYLSPISNSQFVRKCCYPGEILSPRGKCVKHNGTDWSPGISTFKDQFLSSNCKDNIQIPVKRFCAYSSFQIHSPTSPRALRYFQGDSFDNAEYSKSMYCNDWQPGEDGALREVVASCTFPAYAWEYESVRPLGAVAAALLAVVVVVAVVQKETRSTAHGRALACHALCLAAANVTQVTAHFANPTTERCRVYAYTAYFFMIAANCWLTCITFNMFLNFRQPLGALAKGARSETAAALAAWRRFGALSAFAWLTAGGLTAFAATVYHFSRTNELSVNFVAPSFFETRTCLFEDYIGVLHKAYEDPLEMTFYNTWGAVFYYYTPAAILVITNAIFVGLTMIRISDLKKGTSVLRRDKAGSSCLPSQHLQLALFYAKLLLATGVLELSVEAGMWTSGREWHPNASDGSGAYFLPKVNQFLLSILATVVDFLRAISVFWLATRELKFAGRAWSWVKGRCRAVWGWVRGGFLTVCSATGWLGTKNNKSEDSEKQDIPLDVAYCEGGKMGATKGCYDNNAYENSSNSNNDLQTRQVNSSDRSIEKKDRQDLLKEDADLDVTKREGDKMVTFVDCIDNTAYQSIPDSDNDPETEIVNSRRGKNDSETDLSNSPCGNNGPKTKPINSPLVNNDSETDLSNSPHANNDSETDLSNSPCGNNGPKKEPINSPLVNNDSETDLSNSPHGNNDPETDLGDSPHGNNDPVTKLSNSPRGNNDPETELVDSPQSDNNSHTEIVNNDKDPEAEPINSSCGNNDPETTN